AFRSTDRYAPRPAGQPVHLKDIHLERGMHCVDCHFRQDVHGDGKLYGEVRNAIEIECVDCHGAVRGPANLQSSGPAGGHDLGSLQTPYGARFRRLGGELIQQSAIDPNLKWTIPQITESVDPTSTHFNRRAAYAKLMKKSGRAGRDKNCPVDEL